METYNGIAATPRKYTAFLVYNGESIVGIYATREKAQMCIDFWARLFDNRGDSARLFDC